MNFLKKYFKNYKDSKKNQEIEQQPVALSLDDSFVHNFITKGGKFLYCTNMDEVIYNLSNIIKETNWNQIMCTDIDLLKIAKSARVKTLPVFNDKIPFFTTCEHLIANQGDLLFTSNQLASNKLSSFSDNFIVYATTSQIVKNTGEGLTCIKKRFSGNIPTNISAIKNYKININEEDFMDYGNTNSKSIYLLLFEDL